MPARGAATTALALMLAAAGASAVHAHEVKGTVVFLDVGQHAVDLELQIPPADLALAMKVPPLTLADPRSRHALETYLLEHLGLQSADGRTFGLTFLSAGLQTVGDGSAVVVTAHATAPFEADARWFDLTYTGVFHEVVTHSAYVFLRRDFGAGVVDGAPTLLSPMHYQRTRLTVDRTAGSTARGVGAMVALGMRHIGGGLDHLLFLFMLLLPFTLARSPLARFRRAGRRQALWEVTRVATAFTVGHSVTLAAGALGDLLLPARPVESAVALSVLLTAVHAWKPLFPQRETWVAAAFGLVHGLAFAAELRGLGYEPWLRVLALAGFNLGVELMQLAVVALALPCLLLLDETRWRRGFLRALVVAGVAVSGLWLGHRAFNVQSAVLDVLDGLAAHAAWLAWALPAVTMVARVAQRWPRAGVAAVSLAQDGLGSPR